MGVMSMAVANHSGWSGTEWQVPLWVILLAGTTMGLGTAAGGWRIVQTLGLRIVQLRPVQGFAAETTAATVIELGSRPGIPLSTTHTMTSAILGVDATRRLSAVRWGVASQILFAWVVTIAACFLLAWTFRSVLELVIP